MSQPEPLTEQQLAHWKRRALRAEAAVYHALWMRPLGPHWAGDGIETAEQMRTRFRQHIEHTYPDLIVRDQHQRVEVFNIADMCGCDPDAEDFEEQHGEISGGGEALCSKKFLGYVCDSCEDEDGEGPAWKSYAVEWPCPPIAALDQTPASTAAPAPPVAPLAASQPSEAPVEPETATRAPTGRVGDPLPAEDFTGTQPCGHDDYHDGHPWHERPDVWCPGNSYDDDQAAAEETPR